MKSNEMLDRVQSWISFNNVEIKSDQSHFYLQGDLLDDFSKYIISNSKQSVFVANPYVQRCSLSDTLIDAGKKNISVLLLTRPVSSDDYYYQEKIDYHDSLKNSTVVLAYHDNIHAKMVIVDNCVAVISSLNFTSSSSSGRAWEAGMVSIEPNVVNNILLSMDTILTNRDTEYQNPILKFEYDIDIELPPHKVFKYLIEPELIPVWSHNVNRVERESALPLQKGAVQKLHMSNSRIIRQVFNEYVENEMFVLMETQVGVIAIGKYDFVPIKSGTKIRINQVITYHSPMNGTGVNLMKGAINSHLEKSFNQLKEMITQA